MWPFSSSDGDIPWLIRPSTFGRPRYGACATPPGAPAAVPAGISKRLTPNPRMASSSATSSCAPRSWPTVLGSATSRSRKQKAFSAPASMAASTDSQQAAVVVLIDASWSRV
jgi:hypothetical protein